MKKNKNNIKDKINNNIKINKYIKNQKMKNKIVSPTPQYKNDYKQSRIFSQQKPNINLAIKPKLNDNELTEIYNYLYDEFFPLILCLTKASFLDKLNKKVNEIISSSNNQKELQISSNLKLISKIKEDITKKYDNDYKILSKEYQNYVKNIKKYNYLTHFRKHCAQTENFALHNCYNKKYGKFIEIKTKNKYNKEECSYVICVECKKCYLSNFISMVCVPCNKKYFSNILGENEDENILPATWEKYHCGSMINEIMKCIKCHKTLYLNLTSRKLVCQNKRCDFISKPESILWKCFICSKDFRSSAKVYNPLEFKILKKSINFALLLKKKAAPRELPCGCEKDISKLTFYHKDECKGELYQGMLIDKEIIVCSKCHSINFEEKYNWICPICSIKFHLHSVIGCKPFSKKKYVINRHFNRSAKNIATNKHKEHKEHKEHREHKEHKDKNINNINLYNKRDSEIQRLAYNLNPKNANNLYKGDFTNQPLKRVHTAFDKEAEDKNKKDILTLKKPKHLTNTGVRKKKHYTTLIEILQKRMQSGSKAIPKETKKDKNRNKNEEVEDFSKTMFASQRISENNVFKKRKENLFYKHRTFGNNNDLSEKEKLKEDLKDNNYNDFLKVNLKDNNNNIPETNENLDIHEKEHPELEKNKTENKIKVRARFHYKLSTFNPEESHIEHNNKNREIKETKENKENREILRCAESTDFSSYKTLSSQSNIKNTLFNSITNSNRITNPLNSFRYRNKKSYTNNNNSKGLDVFRFSKLNDQGNENSFQDIINELRPTHKLNMETENNSSFRLSLLESNSKMNDIDSNKKSINYKVEKNVEMEEIKEKEKNCFKSPKHKESKNLYNDLYNEEISDDEINIEKDENAEDIEEEQLEKNEKIEEDETNGKLIDDEEDNSNSKIDENETNGKIEEDETNGKIDDEDDNSKNSQENETNGKVEEDKEENSDEKLEENETNGKLDESDENEDEDKEEKKKEREIYENEEINNKSGDKNIKSENSEESDKKSDESNNDEDEDKFEELPFSQNNKEKVREPIIFNNDLVFQSVLISQEKLNSLSKKTNIPSFNESDYNYIKSIGEGTYGMVYLVENNNTFEQFALKKIVCRDYNELIKHKNELELIFSVKHEHILNLYGLQFKYLDETTSAIYVLMELAQNDWNNEIKRRMLAKKYYKEYEIIDLLRQIIEGFLFLKDKDIAHRDIKPQNILLFPNNVYKIADFGEAKNIKNIAQASTLRGSELYMSPILYKGYKFNKKNVLHNPYKSDVFSLGYCLLYAICLNLKVLESVRELTTMRSIISCVNKHIINKYSDKLMDLIYKMIEPNEDLRLDFEDLSMELDKNFN